MAEPDWEAIEAAYRAGKKIREIARLYGNGITEGAIRKRAKKYGWPHGDQDSTQSGTQVRKKSTQSGTQEKTRTDETRASKGKDEEYAGSKIAKSSNTKRNRRSGNPNPTPRFEHGNTSALKHGGYARRMLWSDEVAEDARSLQLEDELFRLRAASLTAAENIGRWTVQLEDATDEQRKVLRENISAADKAMMRNTVRIESLERTLSTLAIDRAMIPKINAETEYKKAVTQKVTNELTDDGDNGVMNVIPIPTANTVDDWEAVAQKQQDESLRK